MAKQKTVYFCSQCGHESSKWMGQCPACKQWNTFTEEKVTETKKGGAKSLKTSASPMNISEVTIENEERIPTGIGELDRVLGGGIVKGSLSLVGGDPGIGKSTLLLQVCLFVIHIIICCFPFNKCALLPFLYLQFSYGVRNFT